MIPILAIIIVLEKKKQLAKTNVPKALMLNRKPPILKLIKILRERQ